MKGQIWSLDLAASMFIFFLIMIITIFIWNNTVLQNEQQRELNEMHSTVLSLSDMFVRTKGYPENWNLSNVNVIGLASEENILNKTKVDYFISMNYNDVRNVLGISCNFYFGLYYPNGSIMKNDVGNNLTSGLKPSNATIVIPIERSCLYDNKISKLKLTLWK